MNRCALLHLVSQPVLGLALGLAVSAGSNNHAVQPIKPPAAALFNVTVDPHRVAAGATADVVVTIKLDSRPVSGAAVQLAMLFTPGKDYLFTPDSGFTDANGTFTATVKVSRNPGDSIIAATSGVLSDQDRVAGTGAPERASAPTATTPARAGGLAPLILLGFAALALLAGGFYINLRSKRA